MNAPLDHKNLTKRSGNSSTDFQGRAVFSGQGKTPKHDVAQKLSQRLKQETCGEVLWSAADKGRYATDASIYQAIPIGVLVPKTLDDVRIATQICSELNAPIVARGAGTSQCGQTVGTGLVIDYSKHINQIEEVDLKDQTVWVQPGVVLDHLNSKLKASSLWFPVDVSTSAQATIGGMAGNNSCGSRSLMYGNMVHNVHALSARTSRGELLELGLMHGAVGRSRELGEFVKALADQLRPELEEHWPKVLRRVAGYNLDIFHPQSERPYASAGEVNLAHLLIGSEGTLALTESLKLKLIPTVSNKVLGVVNFPTFYSAMQAPQHIVKMGGKLISAVELVDKTMIELSLQNPAFESTIRTALSEHINNGQPAAILLVEFSGDSRAELLAKLRELVELMGDLGLPGSVVQMQDATLQKNLWEVRKAGLNIMMSLKGDGKPVSFIEDCAVPLESLAQYTQELSEVFVRHETHGTWYAHASVGTLHVRPILDMRREGASKMRAIAEEASALVAKYRGAYSGEHGDGICRGEWIKWQYGEKINDAFRAIKKHLDPMNLLSPGRIIDPPKMDDQSLMRFPPSYKVIPLKTALDWSAWDVQNNPVTQQISEKGTGQDPAQGFAKAVEMCNNNGHCRKFDAGTMCPSYRATLDERDLTRGRANTLRLALSGQLGEEGLSSPLVQEAMDLCVGCKGCKRECPTGVDMARMKIEAKYHAQLKYGLSLMDYLVGYLPKYARYASRFATVLNLRNKNTALAKIIEWMFGFAAKRDLPKWSSAQFFENTTLGVTRQEVLASADTKKCVVLFVDTFNAYLENASENAFAALRVLSAAGYKVHILTPADAKGEHLCCGRTYLSVGLVQQAKASMRRLIEHLSDFTKRAIPIVGLEPSCLLTLRDEATAMDLGEVAEQVARSSVLFEEFLAKEDASGQLQLLKDRLDPARSALLVHAHCHQKAFDTVDPLMRCVRLLPNAEPRLIETSCCGMAGSFGYERDHYEVSIKMAEAKLLPALRKEPHGTVVAGGTSCRHQINDTLNRKALHVAKLLSDHLNV